MAEVPQIVVQRLQRDANLQRHPDADLVNAFVENLLNQQERNQVLEHLADCRECREIVALSFPEHASAKVGHTPPAAAAWVSWPVLRWAGVAVCVVVVGTAVTLHFESRSRSRELIAAQSAEVANFDQKVVQPATPAGRGMAKAENKASVGAFGKLRHSAAPASKKVSPLPSAAPANAPETQDAVSLDGQASAGLQSLGKMEARAMAERASAVPSSAVNELVPGRAKEAESAPFKDNLSATAGSVLKQKTAALAVNKAMLPPAARMMPKWTLSSDGTLQRSLDGGKSWETIPVGSQATFRALAANGLDIWLGGPNGALYHSSDAGEHWTQVQPAVNGELLSADIIGVEFADPQHGKISTSAHETWTTDDAGQTWQKK